MVNIPRIHCHSPLKHYLMHHYNYSDSSYGNSVFNTTYNFNGGSMCGGGFWGGLLGGLGMGLGAGLMNLLGGGMFGGGMGMFGGSMFGGGMGMFGGGMFGGFSPITSWWGGSQAKTSTDGAGGKDKPTDTECKNKDEKILTDLGKELDNLSKKETITQEEINELIAKIKKCKDESDDIHKDADDDHYKLLLEKAEKLTPKQKVTTPVNPVEPNPVDNDGDTPVNPVEPNPVDNDGNTPVNPVEPNPVDNDGDAGKDGTNPVENSKKAIQIALHFARHDKAGLIDDTIRGTLKGIKTDDQGNLQYYIIDCNTSDSKFKLRYQVTYDRENDKYNVKCINTKQNNPNYKKLYRKVGGVDYTLKDGVLINETNDTVVSTTQKDGYELITHTTEELDENTDYDMPTDFDEVGTYEVSEENNGITVKKEIEEQREEQ